MLTIKIDSQSPYQIVLPKVGKHRDILELGQVFRQYENSLPAEERTPKTGEINTLVLAANTARQQVQTAETKRKQASEELKRAERQARRQIRLAHRVLEATFVDTPERAQEWGFIVRQTGPRAGRILLPASRQEMLDCLNAYITMEESRPAAERFLAPSYDQMVAARAGLIENLLARDKNLQLRKQAQAQMVDLSRHLRQALKQALTHLIFYECGGEICRDLENWGFKVTARQTAAESEREPDNELVAESV